MGLDDRSAQLAATAARLRLDAAAADLFAGFDASGVKALLLKGPSITQWLYPEGEPRSYQDCDFLVPPADRLAAEHVLESAGYRRDWDDRKMPSWWREHASAWLRESDGLTIDLHRTLVGVGVSDDEASRILFSDPATVVVHGSEIRALRLPARALHVVLHAAQHGPKWSVPLEDLRRAVELAGEELWSTAAALAERLDAIDAFVTGLRLDPVGAQMAARLNLPAPRSTAVAVRASTPPPLALGFEQLASATTWRARFEILWRKAVPPREFLRHWDARATRGRSGLIPAYLRRFSWLLSNAPRGLRARRHARRSPRRR